jgi:hypothetical protein
VWKRVMELDRGRERSACKRGGRMEKSAQLASTTSGDKREKITA